MIRNLEIVLLSKLSEQASTGYDLSKLIDQSPWKASHQQIYRCLSKLEQNQLLDCTVVPQQGKPDKKCYSITDSGRDALMNPALLQPVIRKMQDNANAMLFIGNPEFFKNLHNKIRYRITELEMQKLKADPVMQLAINREMRLLAVDAEWCRDVISYFFKSNKCKVMEAA